MFFSQFKCITGEDDFARRENFKRGITHPLDPPLSEGEEKTCKKQSPLYERGFRGVYFLTTKSISNAPS